MKFWDASAVAPLLAPELMTTPLRRLYDNDPVMFAWWGTEIECTSALARRQRHRQLREDVADRGYARLIALRAGSHEVEPGEDVREAARRFLRVHDLRTADALQFAAAFFAARGPGHDDQPAITHTAW